MIIIKQFYSIGVFPFLTTIKNNPKKIINKLIIFLTDVL